MSLELKMKAIKKLQQFKKLVDVRLILLDSHHSSLSSVWGKDLSTDASFSDVIGTLDKINGDLNNGYYIQTEELLENNRKIESIGEELWQLYNKLLKSENRKHF